MAYVSSVCSLSYEVHLVVYKMGIMMRVMMFDA